MRDRPTFRLASRLTVFLLWCALLGGATRGIADSFDDKRMVYATSCLVLCVSVRLIADRRRCGGHKAP